jgi:hypothetical protein
VREGRGGGRVGGMRQGIDPSKIPSLHSPLPPVRPPTGCTPRLSTKPPPAKPISGQPSLASISARMEVGYALCTTSTMGGAARVVEGELFR